jgi:NAD(P)-dependent dehydrogenase (short-subunit alcohol dehydrogenase family)
MLAGILKGKVAIVTGAGRGIGRGIAEELAAEGARVVVASRTARTVDEVVHGIEAKGGEAIGIACDVGDAAAVRAMVAETVDRLGGVNILVNNAQGFGTRGKPSNANPPIPLESYGEEEWDWTYRTGFTATLISMQAAFPHMKQAGGGAIINFGSGRGTLATPFTAPYNVTKEAVRTLSRTAANEWGKYGIRTNVINPVIATDAYFADVSTPEARAAFEQTIPTGFIGVPRDVGRLAVFLASDDARYINGQTIQADGGLASFP